MPDKESFCLTCGAAAIGECFREKHALQVLSNRIERQEQDDYAHTAKVNPVTGWTHYPDGGSPTFDEEQ